MTYTTADDTVKKQRKKFEKKQERIKQGKAKKDNKKDWRLGAYFKECR